MALEMSGLTLKEISQITGYTESRVSIILNDDRAAIDRNELAGVMQEKVMDVRVRLEMLSNEALSEVVNQMRASQDENIRQRAAFSILDRAGYGKVSKVEHSTAPVDDEFIDLLEETMREITELEEGVDYEVIEPQMEEAEGQELVPMAEILDD